MDLEQLGACFLAALLTSLACASETSGPGADEADEGSADSATDASETDESETGDDPLAACEGLGSPFLAEDCLAALQAQCRALPTRDACEAQAEVVFDDGSYIVECGWAKLVRFTDADTCTIDAVEGRCEAGLVQWGVGCGDKCTDTPDLYASLRAIVSELTLLEMPCAKGGALLDGPLGPASAVGSDLPRYSWACAPDVLPPAPALCECAEVACAAQ